MNEQQQELIQALSFYQPPPASWYDTYISKSAALGEWIWQVIQGDFNEHQTTGQVVAGTVISTIPLVDQLCDLRDLVANCRKIDKEPHNTWDWVSLGLTLIDCFPVLGSLTKGCVKVMLLSARKAHWSAMSKSGDYSKIIHRAVTALDECLAYPQIKRAVQLLRIHNTRRYLAEKLDKVIGLLHAQRLTQIFAEMLNIFRGIVDYLKSKLPSMFLRGIDGVWQMLMRVRNQADNMLARLLRPFDDYLTRLANRLRVEGDKSFRTELGTNVHRMGGMRPNREIEMLRREKPDWVDLNRKKLKYEFLDELEDAHLKAIDKGWPDIRSNSPNKALEKGYKTFDKSMHASEIAPGDILYRVVGPCSYDNSYCWMRKAEFEKLQSKSEWRRRYAVWKDWNANGEFVTYTVPPGQTLKVWEGKAATQVRDGAPEFSLEGGAIQIVVDPTQLKKEFTSKRQKTGWGYGIEEGETMEFLGLPELETINNWYGPKE